MKQNNRQRAKLTLDELEKEMEILTKEEMKTYKGGQEYVPFLSGYVAGFNLSGFLPPPFSPTIYMVVSV